MSSVASMYLTAVIFTFLLSATAAWADDPTPPSDDDDTEEIVVTGTRTGRRLGEEPVAVVRRVGFVGLRRGTQHESENHVH